MIYSKTFLEQHEPHIDLMTSCANLHSDPMIYAELSGAIVGCNEALLELLHLS